MFLGHKIMVRQYPKRHLCIEQQNYQYHMLIAKNHSSSPNPCSKQLYKQHHYTGINADYPPFSKTGRNVNIDPRVLVETEAYR